MGEGSVRDDSGSAEAKRASGQVAAAHAQTEPQAGVI